MSPRWRPSRALDRAADRAKLGRASVSGEPPLNAFNYLLSFAAVVLGLAVTDLGVSLNRLIRVGARVRWGLLAPLAALVSFTKVVVQWWSWYVARSLAEALSFEVFAAVITATALLFLMCAAALPDEIEPDGVVDLDAHYFASHRRFWLLFEAQSAVMGAVTLWVGLRETSLDLTRLWPLALAMGLGAIPLIARPKWAHTAVMIALVVSYLSIVAGQHLAAG